jgi:hypothetical protein
MSQIFISYLVIYMTPAPLGAQAASWYCRSTVVETDGPQFEYILTGVASRHGG